MKLLSAHATLLQQTTDGRKDDGARDVPVDVGSLPSRAGELLGPQPAVEVVKCRDLSVSLLAAPRDKDQRRH